jgi:hypothetical protein
LSSFIVGLFERICLNNVRGRGPVACLQPGHIVFRSPVVQSPIPGAGDPADLTNVAQIFRNFWKWGTGLAPNWRN